MFLRKIGRQFLLLHSYREGATRVRQLVVERFKGVRELQAGLDNWSNLQLHLETRFPGVRVDWDGLHEKLLHFVERESGNRLDAPLQSSPKSSSPEAATGDEPASAVNRAPHHRGRRQVEDGAPRDQVCLRVKALRRALSRTRRLISQESDPEVLRLVGRDLSQLAAQLDLVAPVEAERVERELAAASQIEADNPKAARRHLRRAQRLRPWDGQLWRLEGELLTRHNRWKGAEKAYREACLLDFHRLPPGRRIVDPGDAEAQGYLLDLDGLAHALASQCRWEEVIPVLRERAQRCPGAGAWEALGSALHRAGKFAEARAQFRKLPDSYWRRHYHEAASWLEQGAVMSALPPLLRAMARNDWPSATLPPRKGGPRVNRPDCDYWECFGELWSEESRVFLRAIRDDRLVRFSLSYLGKKRARARVVIPPEFKRNLVRRALVQVAASGQDVHKRDTTPDPALAARIPPIHK